MTAGRAPAAVLVALVLLGSLTASTTVAAQETPRSSSAVDAEELRALASDAREDPAALERLRAVEEVDGRAVDVDRLLAGAGDGELEARLGELATGGAAAGPSPGGTASTDATSARDEASAILDDARYQGSEYPRPLEGLLESIGDRAIAIGEDIAAVFPGGGAGLWTALGALVLALSALVASRAVRRRGAAVGRSSGTLAGPSGDDPAALERAADHAERSGELGRALRLRFRAGLLRLDSTGAIRLRPSLPTAEVGRRLRSPDFDRLAAEFDAVAYGGRRPDPSDLDATRRSWSEVLRGVEHR